MAFKLPYAPLPLLEQAVRNKNRIRFTRNGIEHEAEPYKITRAQRTGAIILRAWLDEVGWRDIPYCEIRGLQVMNDSFPSRELPQAKKLARLA